jgi:hypothetical protein
MDAREIESSFATFMLNNVGMKQAAGNLGIGVGYTTNEQQTFEDFSARMVANQYKSKEFPMAK